MVATQNVASRCLGSSTPSGWNSPLPKPGDPITGGGRSPTIYSDKQDTEKVAKVILCGLSNAAQLSRFPPSTYLVWTSARQRSTRVVRSACGPGFDGAPKHVFWLTEDQLGSRISDGSRALQGMSGRLPAGQEAPQ